MTTLRSFKGLGTLPSLSKKIYYGTRRLTGGTFGIHVLTFTADGALETDDRNMTPWPTEAVALEHAKRAADATAERERGVVVGSTALLG